MHDNSGYGFDPHDDSDFLTIHDNTVYNNGFHGIIASKRCNGVSIQVNATMVSHFVPQDLFRFRFGWVYIVAATCISYTVGLLFFPAIVGAVVMS